MPSITYTIPDEKFAEFKEGFLKCCPVPALPDTGPLYTENEWIREWGWRQFVNQYKRGKRQMASEQAVIDEGVVT